MHAVILLAGYGSRLSRDDLPHKSLLPFDGETLLSRHLDCLQTLGMERTHLVLGHNKEAVKEYVHGLNLKMDCHFIDNDLYRTTGNTLSVVMGLRHCHGDVLILDGDVLYPQSLFYNYVKNSTPTSFALIPSDIDNTESSKVLIRSNGTIEAFVTKRDLTWKRKPVSNSVEKPSAFSNFQPKTAKILLSIMKNMNPIALKSYGKSPLLNLPNM